MITSAGGLRRWLLALALFEHVVAGLGEDEVAAQGWFEVEPFLLAHARRLTGPSKMGARLRGPCASRVPWRALVVRGDEVRGAVVGSARADCGAERILGRIPAARPAVRHGQSRQAPEPLGESRDHEAAGGRGRARLRRAAGIPAGEDSSSGSRREVADGALHLGHSPAHGGGVGHHHLSVTAAVRLREPLLACPERPRRSSPLVAPLGPDPELSGDG